MTLQHKARVSGKIGADGEVRLSLSSLRQVRDKPISAPHKVAIPHGNAATAAKLDYSGVLQDELADEYPIRVGHGQLGGKRSFTHRARRFLREAAAVLEAEYGFNSVFLTGTLPGGTTAALKAIAAHSAEITELVNQWCRDTVSHSEHVGVWEWQKRGALHLHWVVGCGTKDGAIRLQERWHSYWCKLLERMSKKTAIDWFERSEGGTWRYCWDKVQTSASLVERSISRYLSKYISKHATKGSAFTPFPPASWWTCAASLKRKVWSARRAIGSLALRFNEAKQLFQRLGDTLESFSTETFSYVNPIIPSDCGKVFYFKPQDAVPAFSIIRNTISEVCGGLELVSKLPPWAMPYVTSQKNRERSSVPPWVLNALSADELRRFRPG